MEVTKRRLPKILADEIRSALAAVERLDPETTKELLQKYRRNRTRYIAAWGLLTPDATPEGLEPIPHEWHSKIASLDEAWQKVHHYLDGGAEDYAALDVMKALNKANATKRRRSTFTDEELSLYLKRRDFKNNTDQASIISSAAEHFDVTTKTIKRRMAKMGIGH